MTTQPPIDADPDDIEEPFDLDPETLEPIDRGDDELVEEDTFRESLFDRTFFETVDVRESDPPDVIEDDITQRFHTKSAG